jgi:uncharacterized protein YbaR (Trm112 family)
MRPKEIGMSMSPDLLEILVCPLGKSELELDGDRLICKRCGPIFAIKDGIPIMLMEEAQLPTGCSSIQDLPCVKAGETK